MGPAEHAGALRSCVDFADGRRHRTGATGKSRQSIRTGPPRRLRAWSSVRAALPVRESTARHPQRHAAPASWEL